MYKRSVSSWNPWFAWRPVHIHGQWTWLKTVYRFKTNNYVNYDDWSQYKYGTIFDVLRDEQKRIL
jgi:hypothetical protein